MQGIAHAVLVPSWSTIHIRHIHLCVSQHGACHHLYHLITLWVCISKPYHIVNQYCYIYICIRL